METYRVRARNTAPDSENRIHDDRTAALYGFRAGLAELSHFAGFEAAKPFRISGGYPKVFTTAKAA